jgi:hypothetical protein
LTIEDFRIRKTLLGFGFPKLYYLFLKLLNDQKPQVLLALCREGYSIDVMEWKKTYLFSFDKKHLAQHLACKGLIKVNVSPASTYPNEITTERVNAHNIT